MTTKDFCDECGKELKIGDNYFNITHYNEKYESCYLCLACFQKHWQGSLPKEKE